MTAVMIDGGAWRAPDVCRAAGVTYRQLDYWARAGYVKPSIAPGVGSGNQRLYATADVVALAIMAALIHVGVGVGPIRAAHIMRDAEVQGGTLVIALADHVTLTVDVAAIRSTVAERLAA